MALLERRQRCRSCPQGKANTSLRFSTIGSETRKKPTHIILQLLTPINHSSSTRLSFILLLQQILNLGARFRSVHSLDRYFLTRLLGEGIDEAGLFVCWCVSGLRGGGKSDIDGVVLCFSCLP
jgi:hypothetical protein